MIKLCYQTTSGDVRNLVASSISGRGGGLLNGHVGRFGWRINDRYDLEFNQITPFFNPKIEQFGIVGFHQLKTAGPVFRKP